MTVEVIVGIQEQIDNDLKQALMGKKETELSVLRLVKTALKNAQIAGKGSLSEEDAMKVMVTQAKQRKDAIEQYEKGGRSDLADKEKAELKVVESYLPEKMGEEEIRKIVQVNISLSGAGANFGQIMGMVMKEVGQSTDGQIVRKIVQEELDK